MSQEANRRPQDRAIDGVILHLKEYLALRQMHVLRLMPKHATILPRIVANQLESLAQVLGRVKTFGLDKYRGVDLLLGEDDTKRKALLSTSDNNSIFVDVMNTGGDKGKKMAEFLITDARTHFSHIDPSLEKLALLVQHYIWWDLPDAAEIYHYEEKVRALSYVRSHRPLPEDIKNRFRATYRMSADAPLSDEQILTNELKALESVLFRFNLRRNEEEPYQNVMAPAAGVGNLSLADRRLVALASHISSRDSLRQVDGELPAEMAESYAQLLGTEPSALTKDMLLQYEEQQISNLRTGAIQDLLSGEEVEHVNFKQSQLAMIRQRVEAEKAAVDALLKESAAAPPPASA